MSELMDDFEYTLKKPFEILPQGATAPFDAQVFVLSAPSGKLFKKFIKMQQIYSVACKQLQLEVAAKVGLQSKEKIQEVVAEAKEKKEKEQGDDDESEAVKNDADALSFIDQMLGSDVDVERFFDLFKDLLIGDDGCCKVEGQHKYTDTLWEETDFRDKRLMAGYYIGNFM